MAEIKFFEELEHLKSNGELFQVGFVKNVGLVLTDGTNNYTVPSFSVVGGTGYIVMGSSSDVSMRELDNNSVVTEIKLKDGQLSIATPEAVQGNVQNGQPLVMLDAPNRAVEFGKASLLYDEWETFQRPVPTVNQRPWGWNITLQSYEYWNGSTWVQY